MGNESQSSDRLETLYGHSGLSMFPRNFWDAPKPNGDDIEPIHNYMKLMALKHPEKRLEQAKVILGAGSELPNSNFASLAASENKDEPIAAITKENLQERRPGLGRKRARFSLKPSSMYRQPSVSLEPILDIAQLQDPEEYLLACERLENAEKELEKLTGGVVTDFNEYNRSPTARRRRPGILGKSFSYKHRQYSSMIFENENTFVSSQETLAQEILSPDGYGSQLEATVEIVESQESELAGSISKTEERVNELLDELLSSSCENLEGDGALSFLQERLQIKPIGLDKLCLPDLHDMGRTDFILMGEKFPKPRKAFSYLHSLVKGVSSRTPAKGKQVAESPVDPRPRGSPTPPKSPFASISLLKKRILQSSLSRDPFSALNVGLSPARNLSPMLCANEEADQVDSRKELNISKRLKSLVIERDNVIAASVGKSEVVTRDSIHLFDKPMKDNNVRSSGANDDLEFMSGSNCIDENLTDENVSRPNTDSVVRRNGSHEIGEHVEDTLLQAVPSAQPETNIDDSTMPSTDFETHRPNEIEENVEDMAQEAVSSVLPDIDIEDLTVWNLNCNPRQLDQSSHAAMEVPSKTPDIASEQHIEKTQEPSRISLHERIKVKRPPRGSKRQAVSCRRSLAEAGTFWESGVRRSSRIKMRPLEYWKGERFLYGRVHESLATIIGVKYVSPAKGEGKPTIKVESYVSDEYKDLVELAALH